MRRLSPAYLKRRWQIESDRWLGLASSAGAYRSSDDRALIALEGRFAGRLGFVVGNGPSLRVEDLTRIHELGHPSIASNKVYLVFEKTPWRPTVLTIADRLVAEETADTVAGLALTKAFPSWYRTLFAPRHRPAPQGANIFFRVLTTRTTEAARYRPRFSSDARRGLFVGQTVTVLNLQLAAWLGFDPIVIVGLDGKYTLPAARAQHGEYGQVAVSEGEPNHFLPEYRKAGQAWSIPRPDLHEKEYERCRQALEAMGRRVINASRSSVILAFERGDLDSILEGTARQS
jgi:hypothetical protein